jgi:tetratricopeptide (TPR) repeat protein
VYDEPLLDLFDIQRDVALKVADALHVRLRPAESRQVAKRPTGNLEAYAYYLRGEVLFHGARHVGKLDVLIDSVITLQRRAIALDSTFALARAALAYAYAHKQFSFDPDPSLGTLAAAEIDRALALDSTLAEAYVARGNLLGNRESGWRYEEALRSFRRALALKPNLAEAHGSLGALLFHNGLLDEALRELHVGVALDPTGPAAPPRIARVLWYRQRFDSSLALFERGQGFPFEHALVLGYLGRSAEGLALLDRTGRGPGGNGDYQASRAALLARLGRHAEAEAQIRRAVELGERTSHFHHSAFSIATAYALMGEPAEALRWLQRTADDGMPAYELFAGDPSFDGMRRDPRFVRFMAQQRARWERFRAVARD